MMWLTKEHDYLDKLDTNDADDETTLNKVPSKARDVMEFGFLVMKLAGVGMVMEDGSKRTIEQALSVSK